MKRIIGLLGCILIFTASAYAKTGRITGTLVEGSTGEALIGALIEVVDMSGSTATRHQMTEAGGSINIKALPYGKYKLTFSFLGFRNLEKEVTLNAETAALGTLKMELTSTNIEAVVLEVPAMRSSQKGDTVIYNAGAFKVSSDATTEGLLVKMPGITISPDGTVEAQGEEIKKILVDGKEFFGDDVSTAIKNLPAEVVESVQVFNKLSDQAEFTGLDDGEGYKALNIVTAQAKRSGQFGKLYAAYGYPDYYTAGGNVNIFQGDTRVSIIGLANNLNQQNFSFEDILGVVNTGGSSSGGGRMGRHGGNSFMVRPMDGISTVQAIGANYSDTWGKKDNVTVTGSYFFNHSTNRNEYINEMWQENDRLTETQYEYNTGNSNAENYNHRFNARIDYKIDDTQSIMLRPWFSYQSYTSTDWSQTDIDLIDASLTTPVNTLRGGTTSDQSGYNAGLSALYRVKLGKQGRTMTVNLDGNYSKNDIFQQLEHYTYIPRYTAGALPDSVGNKNSSGDSYSYRIGGSVTYTEPLSKKSQLNMEYRINYNYSDAQSLTYLWDPLLELINPSFSEELSSINNSGYLTQRVGPGYRYAAGKTNVSVSVMYQYATLDNNIEFPIRPNPLGNYAFNNVVYSGMANFNFNQQNSLRLHARGNTRNPSISQLQDVPDFSGSTTIRSGNPNLQPSYSHNLNAYYVNSNIAKGRTLTITAGGQYTTDYIGNSIVTYDPDSPFQIPNSQEYLKPGQRYSSYGNIGESWMIRTGVSYGLPVKFLASNLTLNLGATFAQTPNIMNGSKFTRNESYYNGGVQLSSNISENIDFTLMYNGSYNIATGTVSGKKSDDRFINQYASANLKWVIWKGITLTGNVSYNQYRGITEDYNEEYVLCNLYLGKKILRSQLAEISIGVNDLFDQNKSFRRTVSSDYIQNSTNLAIGRYIAVQFVYNLRNFSKGATRDASKYDNFESRGSGSVGVQRSGSSSFGTGSGRAPHAI